MLLVAFFCFLILSLVSADQREIKVNPGQDVSLQCRGPRDASVTLLEWTRPDLKSDGYVFFYRNERPYENYQHPSFNGRVELRDPEMKDGDASVVLKNVTFNDTGTYECRIITNARKQIKHVIDLKVTDSAPDTPEDPEKLQPTSDNETAIAVPTQAFRRIQGKLLAVFITIIVCIIAFIMGAICMIYRSCKNCRKSVDQRPDDEEIENKEDGKVSDVLTPE
ncbi:myelin-oligodendrocyte glycoprotein-like [Micropterus salmoides]|uniref:myelin-oligodendrocyte glycoprotein-like n=1 Tax=Micropterus salmoides TaxID=27706 RepID=UPI0018EA8479|nr:myelin-oligodendrocyte glycoprotein-like [Micropterus salmoides]